MSKNLIPKGPNTDYRIPRDSMRVFSHSNHIYYQSTSDPIGRQEMTKIYLSRLPEMIDCILNMNIEQQIAK